jgi:UPF0716 protein FxsA
MPIILLLFLFPIAEIYLFFYAGNTWGWPEVFLWTAVSFFVGKALLRRQTQILASRQSFQSSNTISPALTTMGAFLIMVPGFISDFIGLALLLPITQRLLIFLFNKQFEKIVQTGSFKSFTFPSAPPAQEMKTENLVIDAEYEIKE